MARSTRRLAAVMLALGIASATDVMALEFAVAPETHFASVPLSRPFFIVGIDEISREWVIANAEHFRERQAIGYVIDAPLTSIKAMQQSTGYPSLVPLLQADSLAREYGLVAYPVFVDTKEGVTRQ